jgi:predicted nucleic acid-binding protein
MIIFVDTSAFLAVLDRDDRNHARAQRHWESLIRQEVTLLCTSYVLVETVALLQNRFGIHAVRVFHEDIMPLLLVDWVGEELHGGGMTGLVTASRRNLSLVDCVSFEAMRRRGVERAFAFDRHFREQGFADMD